MTVERTRRNYDSEDREDPTLSAERARPAEPVAIERHAEQIVSEQRVGPAADPAGQEEPVHDTEERYLEQRGQAPGEHPGALRLVQGSEFALQSFWLACVPLLQFLNLRRQPGTSLCATRTLQRVEEPDDLLEATAGTPGPRRQRAATESAAGQRRITEGGVRRPPGSPWALGGGTGQACRDHSEGGIRLAMT
jgi:hypothetical protein